MDITGFEDGPPVKVGTSIADLVAGMSAAHGVTLALLARHRTKRGQKVEISMQDAMAALLTYQAGIYFGTGNKAGPARQQASVDRALRGFQAADAYLTLGVANNSLWERCCAALGHPELMKDPRYATEAARVQNRDVLVPRLNEILGTRSADDWLKRFEEVGVPAGRIRTVAEVCESAHLKARGMIVTLPHPKAGDAARARRAGAPARHTGQSDHAAAAARPAHRARAARRARARARRRSRRLRTAPACSERGPRARSRWRGRG